MVEVAERKDLEAVQREVASLRAGLAGLTETVERHLLQPHAHDIRLGPPPEPRWPPKRLVLDVDAPLQGKSVADVAALGPFRASPHAKDQILTAGGVVFLALYDAATRDAVVALLNGS